MLSVFAFVFCVGFVFVFVIFAIYTFEYIIRRAIAVKKPLKWGFLYII